MRKKPTVADLRALKGKGQRTMLRVMTLEEAAAAEEAGIDIVSVPQELVTDPDYRRVAPTLFSMTGLTHLRGRHPRRLPSLGLQGDERRRRCRLLLGQPRAPSSMWRASISPWSATSASCPAAPPGPAASGRWARRPTRRVALYHECKAYEDAGAFAVEIEVVPVEVASAISARLKLLLWSMGAGAGCDAQYLFACDILARTRTTCRATQKSTATSRPNSTACRPSASPPSANSPPMSTPAPIRKSGTWSECQPKNWPPSRTPCHAHSVDEP